MPKNSCIMQIWAESGKSALPICNYSQILYQFLTFTQNLKRSRNDGTSAPVQIANYSGDSWTLTFTGVKVGVRYHFHYELYSVGSSQVGYIASAAYAQ